MVKWSHCNVESTDSVTLPRNSYCVRRRGVESQGQRGTASPDCFMKWSIVAVVIDVSYN